MFMEFCFNIQYLRTIIVTESPLSVSSVLSDSCLSRSVVKMVSNTTDQTDIMETEPNISFIIPLWIWILMLVMVISFLMRMIGRKFQYNMEAMFFIQLLLLLQLWLFYVEVLIRSMLTMFISTTPYFIMELIHFCILMNRDIVLLIQQGMFWIV